MKREDKRTPKEKFEAEHRKLKRGHPPLRKKPPNKRRPYEFNIDLTDFPEEVSVNGIIFRRKYVRKR